MRRLGGWPAVLAALGLAVASGCATMRREGSLERALSGRRLMVPVAGLSPSDVANNFDAPRDGGRRRHLALDIFAPAGTPVLSADDGVLLGLKRSPLGGNTIYAADPTRRFVYYYAHLSQYHPGATPGRALRRGDVIGYVGSSGNASARSPHLHFQVRAYDDRWWTGQPVNPYGRFAKPGRAVRR